MPRDFYEQQTLTRGPPVGSPGFDPITGKALGISVAGIRGYRVTLTAPAGQTLTGGFLRCYLYHPVAGWLRNPELDLAVTAGLTGQAFPDIECTADAEGRAFYATDGVTVSGTATVPSDSNRPTVRLDGGDPR